MDASRAPLRLAIVNDYELVVAGLAGLLGRQGAQVKVVEMTNRLPVVSDVDIVLMDTFASVARGAFDVSTVARDARANGSKLVIYSWVTHPDAVQRTMSQGAASYLWKGLGARDLLAALELVRSGRVVTPGHGSAVGTDGLDADPDGASWPGRDFGLSTREAEVLALIAKGLSNEEITRELYLGINTVKTYIRTAYRKIGVTSRTQAVLWALDNGFTMQARRAFPTAAGFDAAQYLKAIHRDVTTEPNPIAEGSVAAGAAWQLQLDERLGRTQTMIPDCMGLSVASALGKTPRTVMAASELVATLDAAQYLSGGPCVEAAHTGTVLAHTKDQLLRKPAWRRFAASATACGVASTLCLPVTDADRVIGTINFYASSTGAFDGHHQALAEIFAEWAPAAIANDDPDTARTRSARRPQQLNDDIAIHVATGMVANQEGIDLDQARTRLDDAAQRAGIATVQLAVTVRDIGRLDQP